MSRRGSSNRSLCCKVIPKPSVLKKDSPADVPNKISQPVKDYRNAVKDRSARVKGVYQVTKDIVASLFHMSCC